MSLAKLLKHLPGKHNQKLHTPKGKGIATIDPYWKAWAGDSESKWVLHGTSVEAAETIIRKGMEVSTENKYGIDDNRPPSTYFTADWAQAEAYGEGKSDGGRWAILEIDIPKQAYSKVKVDELDLEGFGQERNFRMEARIPADWVRGYRIYENGEMVDSVRAWQVRK